MILEKCTYCNHEIGVEFEHQGRPILLRKERDHFIPKVHGGSNESWNMVVACQVCNRVKGTQMFSTVGRAGAYLKRFWLRPGFWSRVLAADAALLQERCIAGGKAAMSKRTPAQIATMCENARIARADNPMIVKEGNRRGGIARQQLYPKLSSQIGRARVAGLTKEEWKQLSAKGGFGVWQKRPAFKKKQAQDALLVAHLYSNHTRWHVNRGIKNPECWLCTLVA